MGLRSYLGNYLVDQEYKIVIRKNSVNIINYREIVDFSSTLVVVRYHGGITKVYGCNLVIAQMMDDEILITGDITNLEL